MKIVWLENKLSLESIPTDSQCGNWNNNLLRTPFPIHSKQKNFHSIFFLCNIGPAFTSLKDQLT